MSHYNDVLEELKNKKEKLASEYITKMYIILRDEECRPPEECRAKIESDCSDIWSEDTIRKYLPIEVKNTAKRKAGKISAEVKKKKAKEAMIKEAKPLVVKSGGRSSSGQMFALIDSCDSGRGSDNSVGVDPTENGSVRQDKQESSTFQEITNTRRTDSVLTEDYFSSLITERLKDEALEELENSSTGDQCMNKFLLLPSKLAVQIYSDVVASQGSEIIPEFELDHDGIRIVYVRISKVSYRKTAQKLATQRGS